MWLVALLGVMVYAGQLYVDFNGGGLSPLVTRRGETELDLEARVPKSDADLIAVKGKLVYGLYCVGCHQPNGRGLAGQFPPLAGSDWVNGVGPNRMIRIVLNGLQGPITVNGAEYNNVMLPWKDQLKDEDIAAVLTYVRANKEWGNSGPPVTVEQVKKVRDATQGRDENWTAAELLGVPHED